MSSNEVTWKDKLKAYTRTPGSLIVMLLVMLSAIMTFAVLIFLIVYDQHSDHDPVITSDRSSIWDLCSDLPCGICKTWE